MTLNETFSFDFKYDLHDYTVPPTNFGGNSKIIKISYNLCLKVITTVFSFDLDVNVPVTIGTIPLEESMRTLLPPTGQGPLSVPPIEYKAPTVPSAPLDQTEV